MYNYYMRHMLLPQDVSREPKYQNIKIDIYIKKNRLLTLGQISAIAARWIGGICLQ